MKQVWKYVKVKYNKMTQLTQNLNKQKQKQYVCKELWTVLEHSGKIISFSKFNILFLK